MVFRTLVETFPDRSLRIYNAVMNCCLNWCKFQLDVIGIMSAILIVLWFNTARQNLRSGSRLVIHELIPATQVLKKRKSNFFCKVKQNPT